MTLHEKILSGKGEKSSDRKMRGVPVSIMMEDSGKLNLLMRRYFMHLASLMHPLSSCLENRYEMPTMTAFLLPWGLGGGPDGAWL
ncbi:hypothetical protein PHAVU_008G138400 [Phaseolus vulgaris]|uniref:Uncharacterized protein n=1 Tax=Phaseolus vulgaris TaxID=3885 RepID=V7B8E6_PHAVU|nr:hypothetical protein PHAVU_008G138400g [Phaseolus vulgaris]ESW12741.1 hypothetical protein PHAVU_008G138400g [Phaseolus vulgaris]